MKKVLLVLVFVIVAAFAMAASVAADDNENDYDDCLIWKRNNPAMFVDCVEFVDGSRIMRKEPLYNPHISNIEKGDLAPARPRPEKEKPEYVAPERPPRDK